MRRLGAALLVLILACGDDPPAEPPLSPADQLVLGRAIAAKQAGRPQEVAGILAEMLARTPPPAQAQLVAGEAAYDLALHAEAVERLTDALARLPSYRPNATTLGFAHYKLGQFAQAATVFRSIVALRPDAHKAHYGLGHVALAEGRAAEARAALEEALRLRPDYLKARFDLGRVLQDEGRLEEAAAAYEAVLVRWPSHDEALFRLAQVRAAQGRQADADAVLARRAEVYAVKEELAALVQRVRDGSDAPATWQRLVVLQDRLGEDEAAEKALRDGLQRFPEDPGLLELRRAGPGRAEPGED